MFLSGDIGFDGIPLPEPQNELHFYGAVCVHEPTPAEPLAPQSHSPSGSSDSKGSRKSGKNMEEEAMEVDEVARAKSPERSRLLLTTSVVDAGPGDGDDVYDYGTLAVFQCTGCGKKK